MVVFLYPLFQSRDEFLRALPLANSHEFLLQGPHQPFRVRIAFWIVITGERLCDAHGLTGLHKGDRCGLTPIISHQGQAVVFGVFGAVWKWLLTRGIKRHQLVPGLGLNPGVVSHNLLGVPIQDQDYINPPKSIEEHCRHINPPPAIWRRRLGVSVMGHKAGFEPQMGCTSRPCNFIKR